MDVTVEAGFGRPTESTLSGSDFSIVTRLFHARYVVGRFRPPRTARSRWLRLVVVVDRRDIGSWLEGPESLRERSESDYPGRDLGLPASGAGSIARTGVRALALIVDWAICSLIASALLGYRWGEPGAGSFTPLLVFVVENILLVGTLGMTIGHRLFGLRVLRVDGERATLGLATIRTVLLALVLPAVIWDKDQRGFHDRIARTMILRVR